MANYYNPYNNYYNNPYYQQPIQQQPTIQQGGFIPVNSEKEATDYPIAQGTSITFIDGKNSRLYVKTKGFSPMEQPTFKRYSLVEIADGEMTPETKEETNSIEYAEKSEIKALKGEIERINDEIKKLSEVKSDE